MFVGVYFHRHTTPVYGRLSYAANKRSNNFNQIAAKYFWLWIYFLSYVQENKFTVSTELEMHHAFLVVCKVCLVVDEMKMMCTLYHNNSRNCILIVLAHWKNSVRVDMLLHSDTLYWDCVKQSLLLVLNTACLAEK